MAANYVKLETVTVGEAGASSVTFNNIPQSGYTDLKIVYSAKTSYGSNYSDPLLITINNSTSTFSSRYLSGNGASVYSGTFDRWAGDAANSNVTANTFGNSEIYIPNYTSANYKSFSVDAVAENNGTYTDMGLIAGLWSTTSAITTIKLTPNSATNFVQYSTFSLYGLAAVGVTPVIAPYASGGNEIMQIGSYWYHIFQSSGTFTPAKGLSCDVLVVAAGGGGGGGTGGNGGSGGGGGGGAINTYTTTATSASTSYTVTVGAGGAGSAPKGSNGGTSSFASVSVALGGGAGGGDDTTTAANRNGSTGGSGGGAGYAYTNFSGTGGTASGSNTYAGANSTVISGPGGLGGGGGGATSAGSVGVSGTKTGGAGGAGYTITSLDSNFTAANLNTFAGVTVMSSGGGGGAVYFGPGTTYGGAGGTGAGNGGAGTDSVHTAAGNATAYGAGGGGAGDSYGGSGGNGGNGLVVIRYLA